MYRYLGLLAMLGGTILGCSQGAATARSVQSPKAGAAGTGRRSEVYGSQSTAQDSRGLATSGQWRGLDRNDYPGDDNMAALKAHFAFTGYWVTNPPGESGNTWTGKRLILRGQGWGFLVLANGRLDAEILKAQRGGTTPAQLGRSDAAAAAASATAEGFRPNTVLFLDQEEGGRLLPEQAAYLLGWTEAVAANGFRPGVYASGQQVEDAPGTKIDTIEDIRARVTAGKLHNVAMFDALDQCPPAPGCTLSARPLSAVPDPGIVAWQYAQSPRRPEITQSCQTTYAADNNCYAPGSPQLFLDMDVANSPDPSHGR